MTPRNKRLGGLSLLLVAALSGLFYLRAGRAAKPAGDIRAVAYADQLLNRLQPGDILFRRGSGLWTPLFSQASRTEGFFSHAGIIFEREGHLKIVHADADDLSGVGGVREDEIDEFLREAKGVAIGRMKAPSSGAAIAGLAARDDWKQLPFDTHFSLEDEGRAIYCTEYVWLAIQRASGIDIVPQKTVWAGKTGIAVDDLLYSPFIGIVYDRRLAAD